jgi:hypothetical protein
MTSSFPTSIQKIPLPDSSTAMLESVVPRIMCSGKQFYVLDSEGLLHDPMNGGIVVVTPDSPMQKAHQFVCTIIQTIKNEATGIVEEIKHEIKLTDCRFTLLDTNVSETEVPEFVRKRLISNPLVVTTDESGTKIYVSKSVSIHSAITGVDPAIPTFQPKYDENHVDAMALYDAFMSIPDITDNLSPKTLSYIECSLIPKLLEARDAVIKLHVAHPGHKEEFKISGLDFDGHQSPSLYFRNEFRRGFYGSVKILPDGTLSYHIKTRFRQGGFKKAKDKIVSHVDFPHVFKHWVKLSLQGTWFMSKKANDCCRDLFQEVAKLTEFHHPNIQTPKLIVDGVRPPRPSLEAPGVPLAPPMPKTQMYMDPGTDLVQFVELTLPKLLKEIKTYEGYIHLIKQIMKVMIESARAIQYLHEVKKVIHNDIKHENILVESSFDHEGKMVLRANLIDFGLSISDTDINQNTHAFTGSKGFVVAGGLASKGRDLYGLGVTYELVGARIAHLFSTSIKELTTLGHDQKGRLNERIKSFNDNLLSMHFYLTKYRKIIGEFFKKEGKDYEKFEYTPRITAHEVADRLSKFMDLRD